MKLLFRIQHLLQIALLLILPRLTKNPCISFPFYEYYNNKIFQIMFVLLLDGTLMEDSNFLNIGQK